MSEEVLEENPEESRDATQDSPDPSDARGPRSRIARFFGLRRPLPPNIWGLVLGGIAFALSLTPSLVPRTWLYQGIASGLSAATGHLIGLFLLLNWNLWCRDVIEPLWSRLTGGRRIPAVWWGRVRIALLVIIPVALLPWMLRAVRWQRDIAELMGARSYTLAQFLLVLPVGLLVWALFVAVGRAVSVFAGVLANAVPGKNSRYGLRLLASWGAVAIATVLIVDFVLPGTIRRATEQFFSVSSEPIRPDLVKPHASERSGGPGSPTEWENLGAYGTRFTALGLYQDQLEDLTGRPSKEPIRAYAGMDDGDDDRERAQHVVSELQRTGAEDRKALLVAPATGTGWVNPTTAQAFELMFDGDTAIASAQYSDVPSAVQFVTDRDRVEDYGRELITAVVDWWHTLPEYDRPKLYIYGESLGTTAAESAFSGIRDIAGAVDGMLLMGPPNSNELHRDFVSRRDPGTSEVLPEYSGGMTVRFAEYAGDITAWRHELNREDGSDEWRSPRVLYLQHPSDPVVWWSPDLILKRPDWLKEDAGFDRTPAMTWMPFVTFWQVTLDLPRAAKVPDGHGHNYGTSVIDGLTAVVGDGWTDDDISRLRGELEEAMSSQGPEKEIGGNG